METERTAADILYPTKTTESAPASQPGSAARPLAEVLYGADKEPAKEPAKAEQPKSDKADEQKLHRQTGRGCRRRGSLRLEASRWRHCRRAVDARLHQACARAGFYNGAGAALGGLASSAPLETRPGRSPNTNRSARTATSRSKAGKRNFKTIRSSAARMLRRR